MYIPLPTLLLNDRLAHLCLETLKGRVVVVDHLLLRQYARREVGRARLGMHLHHDLFLDHQRKQLAERFAAVDLIQDAALFLIAPARRLVADRLEHLRLEPFQRRVVIFDNILRSEPARRKIGCAGLRVHLQGDALQLDQSKKLTERGAFLNRLDKLVAALFPIAALLRNVHSITPSQNTIRFHYPNDDTIYYTEKHR